ncbi:MAG: hypothetical protein ACKOC5_15740, partial [Chloroflexota bacterium]
AAWHVIAWRVKPVQILIDFLGSTEYGPADLFLFTISHLLLRLLAVLFYILLLDSAAAGVSLLAPTAPLPPAGAAFSVAFLWAYLILAAAAFSWMYCSLIVVVQTDRFTHPLWWPSQALILLAGSLLALLRRSVWKRLLGLLPRFSGMLLLTALVLSAVPLFLSLVDWLVFRRLVRTVFIYPFFAVFLLGGLLVAIDWLRLRAAPPPRQDGMRFVVTAGELLTKIARRGYIRRVREKALLDPAPDTINLLEQLILKIEYAAIHKRYEVRTLLLWNTPLAVQLLRGQVGPPQVIEPTPTLHCYEQQFAAWERRYSHLYANRLAGWSGDPLDELYRLLEKLRQEHQAAHPGG